MRALGLSVASGQKLVQQLQANHDKPYHAGRLMNGKTYIITQNDKLYYGLPNALKEVPVTHATRNRCIDQQTRDYTAENGLHIRIQTKDNQRNTNASFSLLGLPVPLPHLKQAPVAVWD